MDTLQEARDKIFTEITADELKVRAEFLKRFWSEAKEFSEAMVSDFTISDETELPKVSP